MRSRVVDAMPPSMPSGIIKWKEKRGLLHELWKDPEPVEGGYLTFCFAGPLGDDARSDLSSSAELIWSVEARNHFEAMTLYYEHMGWGEYTTDFPEIDKQPYSARGWE